MRLVAALLLFSTWNIAGAADDVFAHPASVAELKTLLAPARSALASTPELRGRFEQKKFLAGVPAPLQSSGEFSFSRERGIRWRTEKPFESQLELSRAGIVERDPGGAVRNLSADQQPALRVVADVFLSLFALDPQLLVENFETFGAPEGSGWVLGLVPRAGALSSAIGKVTIHGGVRVERVALEDRHGDRTELTLSEPGKGNAGS